MKQIALDDGLRARLKAVDEHIDPDKITVFRAAALTTAPVRKRHPLFHLAVHSLNYLNDMMEALKKESLPLQSMHEAHLLPIGRIFEGEISIGTGVDGSDELITLFWVDNEYPSLIAQINSGTIDQVSVSTLAKSALSSKTGFDFLAPGVDPDLVWSGTDDKGNRMGQGDGHVIIDRLDTWFEMSVVGQGGAQGARILGDKRLHLSASNQDVPSLTLQLTTGSEPAPTPPTPDKDLFDMDAKDFANLIAENATKLANAETARVAAEAARDALQLQLTAATTELNALKGSDAVTQLAAVSAERDTLKTDLTAARELPTKLLAPLFTSLGNATFSLPAETDKAVEMVKDAVGSVRQLGHQLTLGMHRGETPVAGPGSNSAFKRRAGA